MCRFKPQEVRFVGVGLTRDPSLYGIVMNDLPLVGTSARECNRRSIAASGEKIQIFGVRESCAD
jgi:hypothetical protein